MPSELQSLKWPPQVDECALTKKVSVFEPQLPARTTRVKRPDDHLKERLRVHVGDNQIGCIDAPETGTHEADGEVSVVHDSKVSVESADSIEG